MSDADHHRGGRRELKIQSEVEGSIEMTVEMRIKALRLMEKLKENQALARKAGVQVQITETEEPVERGRKNG